MLSMLTNLHAEAERLEEMATHYRLDLAQLGDDGSQDLALMRASLEADIEHCTEWAALLRRFIDVY